MRHLTNGFVIAGVVVLIGSVFLPARESYSPADLAFGYSVGGTHVQGPEVFAIEMAPFGVGVVVLLAALVRRWRGASTAILVGYAAIWVLAAVVYFARFFRAPDLAFRPLWAGLAIAIGAPLIVGLAASSRSASSERSILLYSLILTGASVADRCTTVAFSVLEQGMYLNVGAVSAPVGAVVLFMALLMKLQAQVLSQRAGAGKLGG